MVRHKTSIVFCRKLTRVLYHIGQDNAQSNMENGCQLLELKAFESDSTLGVHESFKVTSCSYSNNADVRIDQT